MKLHFNVGKEEIAETILTKLDDSRKLAISSTKAASEAAAAELHTHRSALTPPPRPVESGSPSKKNGVSVRFAEESPEIIPPREPSEEDEAEEEEEGGRLTGDDQSNLAIALYDFEGTGPDELSVQEGEQLYIIEKEGEEWWKCRNAQGGEGVVPASYLEVGVFVMPYDVCFQRFCSPLVLRYPPYLKMVIRHKWSENGRRPRRGNAQLKSLLTRSGRRLNRNALGLRQKHKRNAKKRSRLPQPWRLRGSNGRNQLGVHRKRPKVSRVHPRMMVSFSLSSPLTVVSSRSRSSAGNPSRDSSSTRTSSEHKSAFSSWVGCRTT